MTKEQIDTIFKQLQDPSYQKHVVCVCALASDNLNQQQANRILSMLKSDNYGTYLAVLKHIGYLKPFVRRKHIDMLLDSVRENGAHLEGCAFIIDKMSKEQFSRFFKLLCKGLTIGSDCHFSCSLGAAAAIARSLPDEKMRYLLNNMTLPEDNPLFGLQLNLIDHKRLNQLDIKKISALLGHYQSYVRIGAYDFLHKAHKCGILV